MLSTLLWTKQVLLSLQGTFKAFFCLIHTLKVTRLVLVWWKRLQCYCWKGLRGLIIHRKTLCSKQIANENDAMCLKTNHSAAIYRYEGFSSCGRYTIPRSNVSFSSEKLYAYILTNKITEVGTRRQDQNNNLFTILVAKQGQKLVKTVCIVHVSLLRVFIGIITDLWHIGHTLPYYSA